jgi:hypothetical protein
MIKAGVSTPTLYSPAEIQQNLDALPVVGRMSTHRSGSGFYLCLNKSDVIEAVNAGCTYFLKFIPVEKEYRVHVFDGVPYRVQEKVKVDSKANKYIRTHSKGWSFVTKSRNRDNISSGVIDQGVKSVCAMDFVFGAADIGVDHKGRVFVFEVNSGASLDGEGTGVDKFVAQVNNYIEKKL